MTDNPKDGEDNGFDRAWKKVAFTVGGKDVMWGPIVGFILLSLLFVVANQ
jgi:hypothetical protein